MARPFSPQSVLRHLPLALVRSFLSSALIPTDTTWDALVDGDGCALHRAYTALAPNHRTAVESVLRGVHELASEIGTQTLVSEAAERKHQIGDALAALPNHHARALWVLVNCAPAFHTARQLLTALHPMGRYWNLTGGFDGRSADDDPRARNALCAEIAALYREQGRGHRCSAEWYERGPCVYLFVYADDYAQTHTCHDERGRLQREPVRPAFEIVFVYTRAAGTLDLYAKGERRWRFALRDLFCTHVLGCDAPVCEPEKREYTLSGLLDRGCGLTVDPARGITSASVRRLRLGFWSNPRRITLEGDPARALDVYDMLADLLAVYPRADLQVIQATFAIRYKRSSDGAERSLTFDVSRPDASNLRSLTHEQQAVGRRCLRMWGVLRDDGEDADLGDADDEPGDTGGPVDPSRAA
jgi:hypothetical protein